MDELKERIDLINIEDEMQRAYIDYSMSYCRKSTSRC